MKKLLFFFCINLLLTACSSSPKQEPPIKNETNTSAALPGKTLFTQKCKICHGANGQLGLSGAANLAISTLSIDEKITVITNGRKGMASFKDQLTTEQIKQVAEYIETLKQ